eukprot:CAMPEP_0174854038 /NCGR_PEP_ID=MMETSP1114-20130205/29786_1 /TAXON_ID=312471 /ORGANISM="Neobodo designis, Strain CCAP 1951/1" /LENGTH=147 /DNA_ID=CAMNT_0016088711 /DNA_START=29 /DNA_END=472 /DNA_ORIENTATION=+
MDSVFKSEEQNDLCPSLTFKQRIIAFFCTLCLGVLFGILAWVAIFQKNYVQFGVFFTLSNCTAIGGSMFLAGPLKQLKKMFEETRWIATSIYLLMMIMTLVAAFAIKSPALVIICCLLQYLAMVWYGLSYIPYARTVVKNCVKGMVG